MEHVKAILFDCVGTLFRVEADHGLQLKLLHERLKAEGFNLNYQTFMEAYRKAYAKYWKIRREELKEVSNMVWVAEALRLAGLEASSRDPAIERAVKDYFQPYLEAVKPVECLPSLFEELKEQFKLGVVTNFTYAPAMREILSSIGVVNFLDVVVISQEVGWRKPHPEIFKAALKGLKVNPEEALLVGDDPHDDVAGAKKMGIKAVLVFKPGNADKRFSEGEVSPDFQLPSVCSLKNILGRG